MLDSLASSMPASALQLLSSHVLTAVSSNTTQLSSAEEQFSTLAILALTSGSLTMIFFVLCVEQLTHFSREFHSHTPAPAVAVGTRFYGCKYLFALLVLGVSSSALIGDGVVAFMRRGSFTPSWLAMPISLGVGILEFSCWSFVFVILAIGVIEFRLRAYFLPARRSRRGNGNSANHDGIVYVEGEPELDSHRFSRLRSVIGWVAGTIRIATIVFSALCIILKILGTLSSNTFLLLFPLLLALVVVINAMAYSGLLSLFFMQTAAFVVVSVPPITEPAPMNTRRYLMSRQKEEPHLGMWIFPGGFMVRRQRKSPFAYLRKKLELANVEAALVRKPIDTYQHFMPEEGVAYKGTLYRAIPTGTGFQEIDTEADQANLDFCSLTFDQMTPQSVPELVREFIGSWEHASAAEYQIYQQAVGGQPGQN